MKTLAQIDDDLHSWDKWEDIRDDYRNGSYTAYFYNKATGRDIKKAIHANSREELKKYFLLRHAPSSRILMITAK